MKVTGEKRGKWTGRRGMDVLDECFLVFSLGNLFKVKEMKRETKEKTFELIETGLFACLR